MYSPIIPSLLSLVHLIAGIQADLEDFTKSNMFKTVYHENGVPKFAIHNQAENAKFILDAASNSNATFTIFCCDNTSKLCTMYI